VGLLVGRGVGLEEGTMLSVGLEDGETEGPFVVGDSVGPGVGGRDGVRLPVGVEDG